MNSINNKLSIAEFVSPEHLPGVLHEIAETESVETALIISDEFGGNTIYISRWQEGDEKQGVVASVLIERIGLNAARQVCQLYGGAHFTIPSCKNLIKKMRNQAICAEVKRGVKRRDLVRKYGISDRQIRSIVSATDEQPGASCR